MLFTVYAEDGEHVHEVVEHLDSWMAVLYGMAWMIDRRGAIIIDIYREPVNNHQNEYVH